MARAPGVEFQRKRLPAWTDRILFRSNMPPEWQPRCERYTSVPQAVTSDHKPVVGVFAVPSLATPGLVVTDDLDSAPPLAAPVAPRAASSCW